jgi:hypothetical protein
MLLADPREAGRLGQILAAAGAPAEAGPVPGEEAARSAFRAAFPVVAAPRSRILARMSGRAGAVVLAGGLVLTGGAAAAAAGALPGAAQQTARDMLAKIGVSVPGADDHAGGPPARHDPDTQMPAPTTAPSDTPGGEQPGHGSAISDLARNSATTGVDHGAAVSSAASGGKSHAGQHGQHGKPTNPSTGKAKKAPSPQATKRHNGSNHKPKTTGAAHTPKPKHTPPSPDVAPGRP